MNGLLFVVLAAAWVATRWPEFTAVAIVLAAVATAGSFLVLVVAGRNVRSSVILSPDVPDKAVEEQLDALRVALAKRRVERAVYAEYVRNRYSLQKLYTVHAVEDWSSSFVAQYSHTLEGKRKLTIDPQCHDLEVQIGLLKISVHDGSTMVEVGGTPIGIPETADRLHVRKGVEQATSIALLNASIGQTQH